MKQYLACFITICLMTLSLSANGLTLHDLQQQFSQYSVVRANFEQDRHINGLSKPLHSSGQMIISKQLGLWWQQKTPFALTLKMNDQRMSQGIGDQPPQIITAQDQPQLFQFNSLLAAIFNADSATLNANFTLTLSEKENQWHLRLVPKTTPLDRIFKQINLTGHQYLSQITIDDMQNDKTVIQFFNHQTKALTTEEKHLFD